MSQRKPWTECQGVVDMEGNIWSDGCGSDLYKCNQSDDTSVHLRA